MNFVRRQVDRLVGNLSLPMTIMLGFLILFVPLASIIGWIGADRTHDSLRDATETSLSTLAQQVRNELERSLIRPFQDIQTLAADDVVASTSASASEKLDELLTFQEFYDELQGFYSAFLDITLLDTDGNEIVSTREQYVEDWRSRDWYPEWFRIATAATPENIAAVSPPHRISADVSDVVMSYAAPVRSDNGEVTAVVVGQWSMETVWAIADGSTLGRTGHTRIVDNEGVVYAHRDRNRLFEEFGFLAGFSPPVVSQPQLVTYEEDGTTTVAAYIALHESFPDWNVVVSQSYGEAFGPIQDTLRNILLGVVGGSLLFAVVSFIWIWRAIRPLRDVSEGAEKVGTGELAYRVPVSGPLEVRGLARSFNEMAANLERTERIRAEHVLLRKLQAASLALASAHVPKDVLRIISNGVQDILSCDLVWILLADDYEEYLETRVFVMTEKARAPVAGESSKDAGVDQRISLGQGDTVFMKAFLSGNPLFLDDVSRRRDDSYLASMVDRFCLDSLNLVPLTLPDRNMGLIVFGKTAKPPLSDEEKRIVLVFAHEATISLERARLRAQEQRHTAELSRLNDLKTRLLHILSHELKTPLTSLRTSARLLQEADVESLDAATRDRLVGAIARATNRLTTVADDIYPIAGVLTDSIKVELRDTDCHRLVRGAVEAVESQTRSKGQTVNVSIDPRVSTVHADRDRLKQVLGELITNASKFSPDGSQIDVTVHDGESQVKFEVRDHGIGISEEDQRSIFDGFYQADNEVVRRAGGKGLGLLFARSVIERHHGKIVVESVPGEGSTFRFSVPARGWD